MKNFAPGNSISAIQDSRKNSVGSCISAPDAGLGYDFLQMNHLIKKKWVNKKSFPIIIFLFFHLLSVHSQVRVNYGTGITPGYNNQFSVAVAQPSIGNTMIAIVFINNQTSVGNSISSISLTGTGSWQRATQAFLNNDWCCIEIWYATVTSTAGTTVTINANGYYHMIAVAAEYSGLLTSGALDVTANASGNTSTASTGTTATTAQANELWIGGITSKSTLGTPTNSFDKFSSLNWTTDLYAAALDRIVTATGTAYSGGTLSGGDYRWAGAIATFKAAVCTCTSTPTATTTIASSITGTTATSGGNVTSAGSGTGCTVTARGVCWNTTGSPTISDNKTTDGSGTGSYTSSITGLSPSATYYYRAYATNCYGTTYGNEYNFKTNCTGNAASVLFESGLDNSGSRALGTPNNSGAQLYDTGDQLWLDLTGGAILFSGGSVDIRWRRTNSSNASGTIQTSLNGTDWSYQTFFSISFNEDSWTTYNYLLLENARFIRIISMNTPNFEIDALSYNTPCCTAAVITDAPDAVTVCAGSNTSFSVAATGATTYNWQVNTGSGYNNISDGGIYSGATTPILTLTGVPTGYNTYQYRCFLDFNSPCGTPSNGAILTVNATPSTTGVTICQGATSWDPMAFDTPCGTQSGLTQGPNYPDYGTEVFYSGADYQWSNEGNIVSNGNGTANVTVRDNNSSYYLRAYDFDFDIPDDATITSFQIEIDRQGTSADPDGNGGSARVYIRDYFLYLVNNAAIQSPNLALTSTNWPTTEVSQSYTFTNGTGGYTWTPSQIENTNFGVYLAVQVPNYSNYFVDLNAYVDYIRVTVIYSVDGVVNWYTTSSGTTIAGTGASFDPVFTTYGPPNTSSTGTWSFYAECSTGNGCRAKTDFVINAAPVAEAGADIVSCTGTNPIHMTGATASGTYSGTPTWSGGTGIWTQNADPALVTFTPSTNSGSFTATLTLTGSGGCGNATDTRIVTWGHSSLTWDAGGGSNAWGTAANWNPDFLPLPCTNVTIPDVSGMGANFPVVSTADAVCNNLTIQPKGQLTISSGATLTSSGTATINSDAIDSNGSLLVNGTLSGGPVTYNRYLNPNRWWIVGAPVNVSSGFNTAYNRDRISHETTYNSYDLAWYKEANNEGWQYDWYTAGGLPSSLDNGRGYLMGTKGDGIVAFTGTLNHADVPVPVTDTGDGRNGWNAVGNPFTSAILITGASGFINLNSSILESNYATAYIWNETGLYDEWTDQYYRAINNTGYTFYDDYLGFGSPLNMTHIQAGQGFLVNAEVDGGTVMFNKSLQSHQNTLELKSAATSWPGVTLTVSGGNQKRYTVLAFNDQTTTGLDKTYDVGLLASSDFILYTRLVKDDPGVDMEIQSLPETYSHLSVPVGINYPAGGQVTFKTAGVLLPQGIAPLLEDRLLGTITPLKNPTDEYTVTLPKNTSGTGRFYLNFGNSTSSLQQAEAYSFSAFFADGKIVISGVPRQGETAGLYDLQGRKLCEYPMLKIQRNEIPCGRLAAGVYMLRIGSQVMKIPVTKE